MMLNKIEPYMRFTGHATRREYWTVMLYSTLGLALWFFINTVFGLPMMLLWLAIIPTVIVQWATIIRRLNNLQLAWWWLFLIFVPYIGVIFWLLLGILPGDRYPGSR